MSKGDQLRLAFANAVRPQDRLSIVDWAAKHVRTQRSSRSQNADLRQTPWLIDPLEKVVGNEASEVVLLAPTGSGKSTILEIAGTYIIAENPAPTQFAVGSDADAQQFFETGLKPALKNCKLIDGFWPASKNAIKKDIIQFTHMNLWVEGANTSNLQMKSVTNQFLDECWMMKQGLIREAKARLHNRFGAKCTMVSQAGFVGDDLDEAWNECYKFEYAYKCPKCGEFHPYDFKNLKWTKEEVEGQVIWETIDAHYECPCGHIFEDKQATRREMSESGKYVEGDSTNPIMGHYGYHYTALNVWWITWKELVIEFLKANSAAKKGNLNFLKQFNQKRLARPWDEMEHLEDKPVSLSDYKIADSKKWDVTILSADVQKVDIWWQIRTWSRSGESRLLNFGKVVSFSDLARIVEQNEIQSNCVFIDSAYRVEEVKSFIAKHKFLGLNGRPESSYSIKNKKTNKTFRRLYDAPKNFQTANGNACITHYSSMGIKDILFILKSGGGAVWEVPIDICEDYKIQINSEVKVIGKDGKLTYKKRGDNNHATDTEAMSLVGAMMHRCYPEILPDD
jgi:energy-coupling factor transporter ATP-binding protein EcfA2